MRLSADTTSNLLKGLKALQSAGEAIPAPAGGIVKCVAGVGITLIETAERVRVNKEECSDIARRAAEQILVLKSWLDHEEGSDEPLSDDLRDRLERYLEVLTGVSTTVERLGNELGRKRIFKTASIQDETRDCLNRLNEAYQMYMFQFSLAADTKLTKLVNAMQVMSLSADSTLPADRDAPDEIRRIPTDHITFLEEISSKNMKGYTVRFGKGKMIDRTGQERAVIVKRFQTMDACENSARDAFDAEIELRRDLLHASFARMLGVSIASRRTKMIVIEAGTIVAYNYLQTLSGLEHILEHTQIMCEFVAGYRFLREHRGSWRGGYQDVLLSAKDKRLCMGGLGRMDGQWEDSGWRMDEAFYRLRDGDDSNWGGSRSFEENADLFERMRESVTKWNEEKTEESARDLWKWLWLWSGSSEIERGTENLPTVGEIGWFDGNRWHPIPLVHDFPLALPPEYHVNASRPRDGEWETIVGTQIGGYTRWSIDASPGEEINLRTSVRSYRTKDMADFFYGSALSLAKDFGVDVDSLRLVTRTGFQVDVSLTISKDQPSTIHYFAYPPNSDGSVPDPPSFWSFSPDPHCTDQHLQVDRANVRFRINPYTQYKRINDRVLPILRDFDLRGFLPGHSISYASDPLFASISQVSKHKITGLNVAKRLVKR